MIVQDLYSVHTTARLPGIARVPRWNRASMRIHTTYRTRLLMTNKGAGLTARIARKSEACAQLCMARSMDVASNLFRYAHFTLNRKDFVQRRRRKLARIREAGRQRRNQYLRQQSRRKILLIIILTQLAVLPTLYANDRKVWTLPRYQVCTIYMIPYR